MAVHHEINLAILEAIGIVNHDNVEGVSIELVPDNFPRVTVTMVVLDKIVVERLANIVCKYRLAPSLEECP